jgi:DNA repair protein RadD
MFDDCVSRVGMRELIEQGFLTPIVGKTGDRDFKVTGVHMQGGDFKPSELQDFMADAAKVGRAVADFMPQVQDRRQVLIFSSGIKHNGLIVDAVKAYDQRVESIDGEMPTGQRDAILARFRRGETRFLANAQILTTGYDDPGIDSIIMLRPTRSPGLLLQCAGRGLRIMDGKTDCLFLDYGGCLQHFGPLDTIEENITAKVKGPPGQAPTKVCECGTVLAASALLCPTCGKEFPRLLKHEELASSAAVISTTPIRTEIASMSARRHQKKGSPPTLRLDYCDRLGLPVASEWLSIDPSSNAYAFAKSIKTLEKWPESPFRRVGDTLYKLGVTGQLEKLDVDDIIQHATRLKAPAAVTTVRDGKYVNVTKKEFS